MDTISDPTQNHLSPMRTTIRHYSTVYKLVYSTSLEHYLQILKDHPFHAYHNATFFFIQHENDELIHNRFFRVHGYNEKGFYIEKGDYIITNDGLTETWNVDGHYECDDLKKIGEDLAYFFALEGI